MTIKRVVFIFLVSAFHPYLGWSQLDSVTIRYIDQYKDIAMEEMGRTGVPASISLAQGIVESQSGTGWLAVHSNNQFGIKCKDWNGPTVRHSDDLPYECFRKYRDPLQSWKDHSDFLKANSRYAFLFQLDPTDYQGWAYGLKRAGYATLPDYPERLISIIRNYHLEQYSRDELAQLDPAGNPQAGQDTLANNDGLRFLDLSGVDSSALRTSQPDYPEGVFLINGLRVLYLPAGSSLLALAVRHHEKLEVLLRDNELPDEVTLKSPSLIYLERKSKLGGHPEHLVTLGENLGDIAQKEGIRLNWLCRRNRIDPGDQPMAGQQLFLQGYAPQAPLLEASSPETSADSGSKNSLAILSPGKWIRNIREQVKRTLQETKPESGNTVTLAANQAQVGESFPKPPSRSTDFYMGKQRYHVVQHEETLYDLSRNYGVSVQQLKQWNHLRDDRLKAGESLLVSQ